MRQAPTCSCVSWHTALPVLRLWNGVALSWLLRLSILLKDMCVWPVACLPTHAVPPHDCITAQSPPWGFLGFQGSEWPRMEAGTQGRELVWGARPGGKAAFRRHAPSLLLDSARPLSLWLTADCRVCGVWPSCG